MAACRTSLTHPASPSDRLATALDAHVANLWTQHVTKCSHTLHRQGMGTYRTRRRSFRLVCQSAAAAGADGQPSTPQPAIQPTALPQPSRIQPKQKTPLQQKILNGILGTSNVPYSSYVPEPATILHKVDARIKQIWLVALYILIARATIPVRLVVAGFIALLSVLVLPPRLCWSQMSRLLAICGFIFVFTALGADGVPPVLQARAPAPGVDGLPPLGATDYHYVIAHVFFITITHRSVNLAVTAATLYFCALQAASLCLVTTPGEEMAMALRWWLQPFRLLRAPVQEMSMILLLSLRFISLVFEEVRNLCLGLAARGVDWASLGGGGSVSLAGRLFARLFANLFHRSENIAQAMVVRGFQGPESQRLYMMKANKTSMIANVLAVLALAGLLAAVTHIRS